jgi:hypothetical protein
MTVEQTLDRLQSVAEVLERAMEKKVKEQTNKY